MIDPHTRSELNTRGCARRLGRRELGKNQR